MVLAHEDMTIASVLCRDNSQHPGHVHVTRIAHLIQKTVAEWVFAYGIESLNVHLYTSPKKGRQIVGTRAVIERNEGGIFVALSEIKECLISIGRVEMGTVKTMLTGSSTVSLAQMVATSRYNNLDVGVPEKTALTMAEMALIGRPTLSLVDGGQIDLQARFQWAWNDKEDD